MTNNMKKIFSNFLWFLWSNKIKSITNSIKKIKIKIIFKILVKIFSNFPSMCVNISFT